MNAPLRTPVKFDVQGLIQAIGHNQTNDNFPVSLSPAQWDMLASYMQPFALVQGQVLIEQGAMDRTLYLLESGSLSVHYEDDKGRVRLAIVAPGSAVGEGAFFTHHPRNATVQAASHCKIWSLTPIRFAELSNRQPNIALELSMTLGSLLGRRLVNKPKRIAVT
ncbi:MAG: cyclic nucleotide-binding domain-containing protein [Ramlibacter sp.]|nr:cyclic nucleotide-binding domain-containing protein [Ramlibacter sp.]MBX3659837.1 cyclic nucleotide-binding domain-containing protein [Ramlibacter sp.]MCW5651094.1 cyclic nucleotide-binding domain-containing protein [Ramlibacter sp.]